MKTLEVKHKGLTYRFEFFESTGEVSVLKEGKPTYTIVFEKRSKQWNCDCPGAVHHGYCWHRSVMLQLLNQPSIAEPWAEWAEEASTLRMERRTQ